MQEARGPTSAASTPPIASPTTAVRGHSNVMTMAEFRRGTKVFAKSGARPYWPGRILAVDQQQEKYHVLLYGLNDTVQTRQNNLILLTEESMETHGRPRRRNSQWRDVFGAAILELQTNPDSPLPELDVNNPTPPAALRDIISIEPFEFLAGTATVKRVPKASRFQAAAALTEVLQNVLAAPDDREAWRKLLEFASTCFGKPKRGGRKAKSLASVINSQIRDFQSGRHSNESSQRDSGKIPPLSAQISTKLSMGDIRGAVRILSSEDKVLKGDRATLLKLQEKHPESHPDTQLPPPPDQSNNAHFIATREDIKSAIKSFRNGSGGGPDRLLPQHLKDLTSDQLGGVAISLLDALTDFINNIALGGNIPEWLCPIFYGAQLIALSKSDDGVRPIAIGFTLRRLAGKVAMNKLKDTCATLFRPHQLGVGTPKGAEIAVHALRRYIEGNSNESKLVLKIDFKNAFNCIRRDQILKKVKEQVPMLYPMVWQSYATVSNLYFNGDTIIQSREGVQQGDPLGPFLFSLGINDLMKSCTSEFSAWYLDDGTLAGSPDTIHADFKRIQEASDTLGLQVNPSKCEVFFSNNADQQTNLAALATLQQLAPEIKQVDEESLTLLGAPIMRQAGEGVFRSKLNDLQIMLERLTQIDAHDAIFLLRHCFAIPKLMYFLRCAPSFKFKEVLQDYDQYLRLGLEDILNVKLGENSWLQSTLPVSMGGLGIRLASDLALPAFLSSAHGATLGANSLLLNQISTNAYQNLEEAESSWRELIPDNAMQPSNKSLQALWDKPLYGLKYSSLLDVQTLPVEKARLRAVASEHASDWLNAIPIPALGLKMDNTSFRIACGLRLGSLLCQPHSCPCGMLVTALGRHGLSCKNAKGTHSRHSQANDLIKRALGSAQVPAVREPPGLVRSDFKRPDGLTLFPWSQGKSLVWDFTCSDTLAPSHVAVTSTEAGKSAAQAERRKLRHYEELSRNFIVTPVAVETLGSWGQMGLKFIKDLGSRISDVTGDKRSTSFLFQSLGMAIQRGNAASVTGTIPNMKNLHELFYL